MRDAEKDLVMCERATPGPWNNDHDQVTKENGVPLFKAFRMRGDLQMRDDARFITEAREALPYWINRAQAAEAEIERLKAENVRVVAASGAGYEKLLEALREIDTHIRATADPVPYIVATLKQALPEYKGWDDASRT